MSLGVLSPYELAAMLGLPPPTDEQAAVIAAPLVPQVVVAGAGSGKSETMAARVVWLVTNGLVRPEQILGLTFTRKAAAELASRVRKRLSRLPEIGLLEGAALAGEPTVATYHAYAASLVSDHAPREGLEPTVRLITPAVAWQLAARVVAGYDGPMDAVDLGPPAVTAAVLELAGEMSEHLCDSTDVRGIGAWLRQSFAEQTTISKELGRPLRVQQAREQLLPLVEAYQRAKAERELIDHGDQVAVAARIAARHPEVGKLERSRFAVVLLDEYQDTSHAQLVLLRSLFGAGHPVTAVGDPCQSIYGWRGASAGSLRRFAAEFDGATARLATSFRCGERILAVAERVQRALREEAAVVPGLVPGTDQRDRGRVVCALHETAEDEATWVAEQVACALALPAGFAPDELPWSPSERRGRPVAVQPSDVAVLVRKRSQFAALRRALRERGIPVELVGLGGLLTVPEVAGVVATLRTLHDATADDALLRLLTGPRWRIGAADLVALGQRARELSRASRSEGADAADPLRQTVLASTDQVGSLIDALDDLGPAERYSREGHRRLAALGDELRELRAHVGQPLPDLVVEAERALGLDIEVAGQPGADPIDARADLDAFTDAAARFAGDAEHPTLGAFLAYLKAAETEEFGLEAGRVGETNTVKLMTVHAAKGLEWPVVIVPGLAERRTNAGEITGGSLFPAAPVQTSRWTHNPRKLPFGLRGDREDLPQLTAVDKPAQQRFNRACRQREELEERRLAYVAVTRARFLLVCSGFLWGTASTPLRPSVFLSEVREVCERTGAGEVALWADEPPDGAVNPALVKSPSAPWPVPPSGERYQAVLEGARLVGEALAGTVMAVDREPLPEPAQRRVAGWQRDVELLLAERSAASSRDGVPVELPAHLSVSSLVTLAADVDTLAARIRRPMPRPPAPYARRGTAFHRWLESRWGQQRLLGPDDLPGAADADVADDVDLEELKRRFAESRWADRLPVDVEVPFQTIIGDRLIGGRMDAVFRSGDGGYEVVDWKTGTPPDPAAAKAATVQLAAYRLAWADLAGVGVQRVSAAFHYVRTNQTVRPVDLLDSAGLAALIERIPTADQLSSR